MFNSNSDKMKAVVALGLIGLMVATGGCSMDTVGSADVQAQSVYQSYSLGYSGDSNHTTLMATFRVGGGTGTTVELSGPSQLLVNGVKAQPVAFLGTNYQTIVGSGYVPQVNLEYTDQNSHVYQNTLEIKPIAFSGQAPSFANLNQALKVPLTMANYSPDDWIQGTIVENGVQEGGMSAVSNKYDSQMGVLEFDPSDLRQLQPGSASLVVTRTVWESLNNVTSTGGSAEVSYSTASVPLTLTLNSGTLAQNVQRMHAR